MLIKARFDLLILADLSRRDYYPTHIVGRRVTIRSGLVAKMLEDHGFRVLIAPSFADIFYNNCFKNGMLPIRLTEEQVDDLFRRAAAHKGYKLTVDLETQTISDEHGLKLSFEVDPFRRHCLLNGLDDSGLTLGRAAKITAYETAHGIA